MPCTFLPFSPVSLMAAAGEFTGWLLNMPLTSKVLISFELSLCVMANSEGYS
jgi:hypothetical protein